MATRMLVHGSLALGVFLFTASPVSAQTKGDTAVGYSFLTFLNSDGSVGPNLGTGWHAAFAGHTNDFVSGVADFGGHYGGGHIFHTFQAGVRVSGRRSARIVPFAQATFGGGLIDPYWVWIVQPGGGVDVPIRPGGPAVRVQADFPFYVNGDGKGTGFRLVIGVAFQRK